MNSYHAQEEIHSYSNVVELPLFPSHSNPVLLFQAEDAFSFSQTPGPAKHTCCLAAGGKHQMRKDATKAPAQCDVSHLVDDKLILKIGYGEKVFQPGNQKEFGVYSD